MMGETNDKASESRTVACLSKTKYDAVAATGGGTVDRGERRCG